ASRDRLEEIPGADLDTSTVGFGQSFLLDLGNNGRQVEEDTLGVRLLLQDREQKRAMAAADVDRLGEWIEFVAAENSSIGDSGETGHRFAEQRAGVRGFRVVAPDRHPILSLEGGAARAQAALDITPRFVMVVTERLRRGRACWPVRPTARFATAASVRKCHPAAAGR